MSAVEPPVKKLILHIEVPDINVDDLPVFMGAAGMDPTDANDTLEVVVGCNGMIREEVGLTIVTMPDEKCMNDDFGVYAYTCRVVGAEIVDRTGATS